MRMIHSVWSDAGHQTLGMTLTGMTELISVLASCRRQHTTKSAHIRDLGPCDVSIDTSIPIFLLVVRLVLGIVVLVYYVILRI
jgi:uncharacterized membrane protein YidH (DUF202 family)